MVTPEQIATVREAGRRERRFSKSDRARQLLAGIVDTGPLSDNDVLTLGAAFQAGRAEPADPDEPIPVL